MFHKCASLQHIIHGSLDLQVENAIDEDAIEIVTISQFAFSPGTHMYIVLYSRVLYNSAGQQLDLATLMLRLVREFANIQAAIDQENASENTVPTVYLSLAHKRIASTQRSSDTKTHETPNRQPSHQTELCNSGSSVHIFWPVFQTEIVLA